MVLYFKYRSGSIFTTLTSSTCPHRKIITCLTSDKDVILQTITRLDEITLHIVNIVRGRYDILRVPLEYLLLNYNLSLHPLTYRPTHCPGFQNHSALLAVYIFNAEITLLDAFP